MHRAAVMVFAGAIAIVLLPESARADWCGVDSKGITNCGYPTAELCRTGLNGVGNCFENTTSAPARGPGRRITR